MLDVSTPKMIYPDRLFNSSQRQVNISIFTPRCEVCLCVVMHTEETYVYCCIRSNSATVGKVYVYTVYEIRTPNRLLYTISLLHYWKWG